MMLCKGYISNKLLKNTKTYVKTHEGVSLLKFNPK